MKKLLCVILMLALVLIPMSTAVSAASRGAALVVYGADPIGAGDTAIANRLKSLGFEVTTIAAKSTVEGDGTKYDLIYISESVTSADISTKFTKAPAFVLCAEPGLWDELQIGKYDSSYDTNSYNGEYTIVDDLVGSGLKTFKGFTKDATPGFLKEWASGVKVIAQNADKAPAVALALKGSVMFDKSTAAGARATFFCRGQSAADFSADSWKLFDSLVNKIIPKPAENPTAAVNPDAISAAFMIAGAAFVGIRLTSKKH